MTFELEKSAEDPAANQPDATIMQELAALRALVLAQQQQLTELNSTITKLSRTQFKANSLMEAQEQRAAAALTQLQQQFSQQQQQQDAIAAQFQQQLTSARTKMATDFLPVLDGLEAAIAHGEQLLSIAKSAVNNEQSVAQQTATLTNRSTTTPNFWQRLQYLFKPQSWPIADTSPVSNKAINYQQNDQYDAWASWLAGLKIVQERIVKLLALENIIAIAAIGESFDPRWHVAIEAVAHPELPAGVIVMVARQGYRQAERVLRYAEVTVSR